jgi:L-iditol 2-dehydrogenase
MRAVKLTGLRQMAMFDLPAPQIKDDKDVLIKMTHVGVCGSDVHYYATGRIGSQIVQYPFMVGHEGSGIVEKTGAAVTRVKPGDRIAIEPATPCRQCDQCLAGRPHTCRKLTFLGCPGQAEGCLSDYILMKEESCYPIPDRITLEEAALSEPLSIGIYAVNLSIPMRNARIGILGCGPIGLSALLPALTQRAEKIYVTDKIDARLAVAKKAGASWAGNPLKSDVVAAITSAEPGLLDAVFECCGQQEAADQAIELLKPGGKMMFIGIPEVDRISFCMDYMRRKEICIQNVRRQNHCVQAALDMIAAKECNVNIMATHHFPLERAQDAFDLAASYQDGVVKAMIEI